MLDKWDRITADIKILKWRAGQETEIFQRKDD